MQDIPIVSPGTLSIVSEESESAFGRPSLTSPISPHHVKGVPQLRAKEQAWHALCPGCRSLHLMCLLLRSRIQREDVMSLLHHVVPYE